MASSRRGAASVPPATPRLPGRGPDPAAVGERFAVAPADARSGVGAGAAGTRSTAGTRSAAGTGSRAGVPAGVRAHCFLAPPGRSADTARPLPGPLQPPVPARPQSAAARCRARARAGWRASAPPRWGRRLADPRRTGGRGGRPRHKPCCDRRERRPGTALEGSGAGPEEESGGRWNVAGQRAASGHPVAVQKRGRDGRAG